MSAALKLVPKFKVSYNLECEYEIGGRLYRVRHGCHHSIIRPDYLPKVIALIGTVIHKNEVHTFPAQEIVALFPGMVGARWTEDFQAVEYDGPKPETETVWNGESTVIKGYLERFPSW